jgi:hypothetical protein
VIGKKDAKPRGDAPFANDELKKRLKEIASDAGVERECNARNRANFVQRVDCRQRFFMWTEF